MSIALLALVAGCGMAFCQWLIYFRAPIEETLGVAQKIFYMHLPLSIWAMASFFMVFCGSLLWLWKRRLFFDRLAAAAAELGVVFCSLSLLTGMIWARKSWGVWWTWDPRLTTALIMWFIYVGYLIIRQMELPSGRRQAVCAMVGVISFLDVPLVFLSARIFRSIHPAVFLSRGGGLEPEMKFILIICLIFWGCLWGALLVARVRQLELERLLHNLKMKLLSGD